MQNSIFKFTSTKQIQFLLLDILLLFILWLLPLLYFGETKEYLILWIPILFNIIFQYIEGCYEINPIWQTYSQRQLAINILGNFLISFILSKYFINLIYEDFFISGQEYFLFVFFPQTFFLYLARKTIFYKKTYFPDTQNILFLGTMDDAKNFVNWLKEHNVSRTRYRILKVVNLIDQSQIDWASKELKDYNKKSCFGDLSNIDIIITSKGQKFDTRETRKLLEFSSRAGFVLDLPVFCGNIEPTYPLNYIDTKWILDTSFNLWFKINIYLRLRTVIDFAISILGILITLPLTIPVSIIIKITSKGPIFFKQERVGRLGVKFFVFKFRSMYIDAEANGPQLATQNDNRVTPIGKFIRKTRIDEIPQFINVLKGEMALIGPRPEREHFENVFKDHLPLLELRNLIKPGITGLAQSRAKYANDLKSYQSKLGYDIYYLKNISPTLDLSILLQTIRTILLKSGH